MPAPEGEQGPPDWYVEAVMAETYGIPPWRVEDEAPAVWVDRFLLLASARAEREHPKQLVGQAQGTVSRRLI